MDGLLLVKLGGSLITDKSRPSTARGETIERLARDVAQIFGERGQLLLGHGSGSFGHAAAEEEGFAYRRRPPSPSTAVARVHRAAADLSMRVLSALLDAGAPALPFAPSSFVLSRNGAPARLFMPPLLAALDAGVLPVVFGDVTMDVALGASICSTESALVGLAGRLAKRGRSPKAAIWLTDTDGVLGEDGKTVPRIDASRSHRRLEPGGARGADVTGGMKHKLDSALRLAKMGIPSMILDGNRPGILFEAVSGRPAGGTRVE